MANTEFEALEDNESANRMGTDLFHQPTSPGEIDGQYAQLLKLSRGELITEADEPGTIPQTGGAYLPGEFPMSPLELASPITEAIIETFVVNSDGRCTATGSDDALNAQWMPGVTAMATSVIEQLAKYQVTIEWPAYLTASLTPLDQVTHLPHFDSDQYLPEAGVDIVAIVANHDGPRMATTPIAGNNPRPGLPIELAPAESERFQSGAMATQQAAANRIVVFPQFGQLHAGPICIPSSSGGLRTDAAPDAIRNLFVFRATSRPGSYEQASTF